jgi:serine/threonine protein kinase
MDETTPLARCPRCGGRLPLDTPERLCPACLFAVAASPASALTGEEPTPLTVAPGTSQEPPRLTPGQSFGPYRIRRILGRGGMGDVYEAELLEQGRRVALKVLSRPLAGPQDRARFLREGQLAASLNHPHTVYIFGNEEIAGTPTIVMELLPSGTLKERVKEHGPLPPTEAVDAILQVIAGLDAMHAAGVLHRDIKPANCFVDGDGTVKVGDFGLSISTLAWDVRLTATGTFHGTPQFAPPEQLKGETLDARADIHAVGATLYYLLTGRRPSTTRIYWHSSHGLPLTPHPRRAPLHHPFRGASQPLSCAVSPRIGRSDRRVMPRCTMRYSLSVQWHPRRPRSGCDLSQKRLIGPSSTLLWRCSPCSSWARTILCPVRGGSSSSLRRWASPTTGFPRVCGARQLESDWSGCES